MDINNLEGVKRQKPLLTECPQFIPPPVCIIQFPQSHAPNIHFSHLGPHSTPAKLTPTTSTTSSENCRPSFIARSWANSALQPCCGQAHHSLPQ